MAKSPKNTTKTTTTTNVKPATTSAVKGNVKSNPAASNQQAWNRPATGSNYSSYSKDENC